MYKRGYWVRPNLLTHLLLLKSTVQNFSSSKNLHNHLPKRLCFNTQYASFQQLKSPTYKVEGSSHLCQAFSRPMYNKLEGRQCSYKIHPPRERYFKGISRFRKNMTNEMMSMCKNDKTPTFLIIEEKLHNTPT